MVIYFSPPSASNISSFGEIEISYTGSLISDFVHETKIADISASIDNVIFIVLRIALIVIPAFGFYSVILNLFQTL